MTPIHLWFSLWWYEKTLPGSSTTQIHTVTPIQLRLVVWTVTVWVVCNTTPQNDSPPSHFSVIHVWSLPGSSAIQILQSVWVSGSSTNIHFLSSCHAAYFFDTNSAANDCSKMSSSHSCYLTNHWCWIDHMQPQNVSIGFMVPSIAVVSG